ncbi:MAG: glutamyl-tRNA reductase [Candidatus Eiseniibacteriota bacterium]
MEIVVHGISHRTAPLEVRERVAFLPEEISDALAALAADDAVSEVALLSTCNRTEFYAVTDRPQAAVDGQLRLVAERKGVDLGRDDLAYVRRHREGIEHLFRVAAGIDSSVLGENAILGQVKTAYDAAHREGRVGPVLGRLFPAAIHAGKRCRTETAIGTGAASLERSAVQLAERVFGDLSHRAAVVVGSGDSGRRVAELLDEAGIGSLTFASRTEANARALADELGGRAVPFEAVLQSLPRTDILVSAVAAAEAWLAHDDLERALGSRRRGSLLVLDLGVPRNVEARSGSLQGVFLYSVEDLQELVDLNVGRRRREIPAVEGIVREEADRFHEWLQSLAAAPVLVAIREEAERVRRESLARFGRGLEPKERELLERFSAGLVNKLLHPPTVALRGCDPTTREGLSGLEWARRFFGLDVPPDGNGHPSRRRRDEGDAS